MLFLRHNMLWAAAVERAAHIGTHIKTRRPRPNHIYNLQAAVRPDSYKLKVVHLECSALLLSAKQNIWGHTWVS